MTDDQEASTAGEPIGWDRVDRTVEKARDQLSAAQDAEDYQRVGLLCREALISLGQVVYGPARHPSLDGTPISDTDATRMLGSYVAVELAGGSNEEARAHAKASLKLANALQHRRTATFRDAALCVEATSSVVNIITLVSGMRDPVPRTVQADTKADKARRKALVEHDRRTFEAADALLSERQLRDTFDHLIGEHYLTRDTVKAGNRTIEFFEEEGNQYLHPALRETSRAYAAALLALLSFTGTHFFTWPRVAGSPGYALYPDLNIDRGALGWPDAAQEKMYNDRSRELSDLTDAVEATYLAYRVLVKEHLLV